MIVKLKLVFLSWYDVRMTRNICVFVETGEIDEFNDEFSLTTVQSVYPLFLVLSRMVGFDVPLTSNCRSFQRQIFPAVRLTGAKKPTFPANQLAATSKTKYNYDQMKAQKPKQQLIKTTNINKTNESEAQLKLPLTLSGQETSFLAMVYYIRCCITFSVTSVK